MLITEKTAACRIGHGPTAAARRYFRPDGCAFGAENFGATMQPSFRFPQRRLDAAV
jgi:hypothetical protein